MTIQRKRIDITDRSTPAESPPRRVKGWLTATVLGLVASFVLLACGGDAADAARFTREDIVSTMAGEGFSGEVGEMADGTPRWLGRGPDSAILEIVGPAEAPTVVTLTVAASASSGELVGDFLDFWAPGSSDFLSSVLQDAQADADQDQRRDFGERTVRVQTLAASDGALVTATIYE